MQSQRVVTSMLRIHPKSRHVLGRGTSTTSRYNIEKKVSCNMFTKYTRIHSHIAHLIIKSSITAEPRSTELLLVRDINLKHPKACFAASYQWKYDRSIIILLPPRLTPGHPTAAKANSLCCTGGARKDDTKGQTHRSLHRIA